MSDSFAKRLMNVSIDLGKGPHGADGSTNITFYQPRVLARIERTGMPGYSTASMRLFGLSLDHMNAISRLGKPKTYERNNKVTLLAGDSESGVGIVFTGTIQEAWTDFNAAPDVAVDISAVSGTIDATKPVPPTSYAGAVDAATVLSGLAILMGYGFINHGVSVILSNPYYPGTARDQANRCIDAADIYAVIDDQSHTLEIWPKDGSRAQPGNGEIPSISPATGMVGYPGYTEGGIILRTLYNPALRFGGQVQVSSSLPPGNGTWIICRLSHQLESEQPGGAWFSDLEAYRLGDPPIIPG